MSAQLVIYTRFTNAANQREDSLVDQERKDRQRCDALGIDHSRALVLADGGQRGDLEDRAGYDQICQMVKEKCKIILVVDQQSRFSRGFNVEALIQDIVFNGGRFIAVGDGIDTTVDGWEELVGIKKIQNRSELKAIRWRVRRAMEGRVLDKNGSAGDFPMGYASEFIDRDAAMKFTGRGVRPKKEVVIFEPAASIIRLIFKMFVSGTSIAGIVRYLVANKIPKYSKGKKAPWDHSYVRRILENSKYIGNWSYGGTTTIRDSRGKKKRILSSGNVQAVGADRPDLRIIDQATWEAAQARLRELDSIFGKKPGQKRRGPRPNYSVTAPKSFLSGCICDQCRGKAGIYHTDDKRYLKCKNGVRGICSVKSSVQLERAERAVLEIFRPALLSVPGWLKVALNEMTSALSEMAREVPSQIQQHGHRLAEVESSIKNLLAFIEKGKASDATQTRLSELEEEKAELQVLLQEAEQALSAAALSMPDQAWIENQLQDLAGMLSESRESAALVRDLLGEIRIVEVMPPRRKRGYLQLRIRVDGRKIIAQCMKAHVPPTLLRSMTSSEKANDNGASHWEFVVNVPPETKADQYGPQFAKLRQMGKTWKQIGCQFSMEPEAAAAIFSYWQRTRAR